MGDFDFLDRLREEPESHRKRTAIVVALSVTGLVFLAWFMSWTAGTSTSYSQASDNATSSPISALKDIFSDGAGMAKNLLGSLSESRAVFTATSTPINE